MHRVIGIGQKEETERMGDEMKVSAVMGPRMREGSGKGGGVNTADTKGIRGERGRGMGKKQGVGGGAGRGHKGRRRGGKRGDDVRGSQTKGEEGAGKREEREGMEVKATDMRDTG